MICKQCKTNQTGRQNELCSRECYRQWLKTHPEEHYNYRHGEYGTPLYIRWLGMKRRCYNKNDKRYPRYGGRGIKVCQKWMNYLGFREDMGGSFKDGYSLERIDNNGNYEKSNCKWIPFKEQAKNRRDTNLITYHGETLCMKDWERKLGFKEGTVRARLRYYGWTIEEALSTKPGERH